MGVDTIVTISMTRSSTGGDLRLVVPRPPHACEGSDRGHAVRHQLPCIAPPLATVFEGADALRGL